MENRYATPVSSELKVAKPGGGFLALEGEVVPWDTYWRRRQREGAVTITPVPEPPAEEPAAELPEEE